MVMISKSCIPQQGEEGFGGKAGQLGKIGLPVS